ncbi:translation initiation factor IF-2-like [Mus musculus]|uniref:translation initiation factor IF-2-like n=1 Tax=Mus musculus TaxID=10090 RepID=UPI0011AE3E57|nr:translation initiation factor IF-2-like [Mus musculus]
MCSPQILQVGPRPSSPQSPPGPGPTSGTSYPPSLAPPSLSTFPQSRNFCGCRGLRPPRAQLLAASARRGTAVALGSDRRPGSISGSVSHALRPPRPAPLQPVSGAALTLTSGGRPLHLRGRAGRVGHWKRLRGGRPSARGRVRIQAPLLRPGPGPAAGRGSGAPLYRAGLGSRAAGAQGEGGGADWRGARSAGQERMNVLWDHVV